MINEKEILMEIESINAKNYATKEYKVMYLSIITCLRKKNKKIRFGLNRNRIVAIVLSPKQAD